MGKRVEWQDQENDRQFQGTAISRTLPFEVWLHIDMSLPIIHPPSPDWPEDDPERNQWLLAMPGRWLCIMRNRFDVNGAVSLWLYFRFERHEDAALFTLFWT